MFPILLHFFAFGKLVLAALKNIQIRNPIIFTIILNLNIFVFIFENMKNVDETDEEDHRQMHVFQNVVNIVFSLSKIINSARIAAVTFYKIRYFNNKTKHFRTFVMAFSNE